MADPPSTDEPALELGRIYSQLLRQQERALERLTEIRDELGAPVTSAFLDELRSEAGDAVPEAVTEVLARVEDALRAIEFCQSEIHRELVAPRGNTDDAPDIGPENLPPALVRFLDERKGTPGFEYDVRRDSQRGWIIWWKEYTEKGTVRGSGQFYERPYAWMQS